MSSLPPDIYIEYLNRVLFSGQDLERYLLPFELTTARISSSRRIT
jgi:hypothetical protein